MNALKSEKSAIAYNIPAKLVSARGDAMIDILQQEIRDRRTGRHDGLNLLLPFALRKEPCSCVKRTEPLSSTSA